jgi:hypothetical protein
MEMNEDEWKATFGDEPHAGRGTEQHLNVKGSPVVALGPSKR